MTKQNIKGQSSIFDLLDRINDAHDLRQLPIEQLQQLCQQLRQDLINKVAQTGGHLGAGLGVVELTVALHYVFNTPFDRLIWDVGHQCYPHKILTKRRHLMESLRQMGGLSGFTKRSESEYDPFGAGHASTSISAALGMAVAQDLDLSASARRNVIAVIGDGAMSGGMAYEAMNNAAVSNAKLIVILNDNEMSIARPVGAMSSYLAKLVSSPFYRNFRQKAKEITGKLPSLVANVAKHSEENLRNLLAVKGTLFEELGFYYIGPVDGHDVVGLTQILANIKENIDGPVLVHVVTKKGKGYMPAEEAKDKLHGVSSFDVATGVQKVSANAKLSYTDVFANSLIKQAEIDEKILAITAAMPDGTGLNLFAEKFPQRLFDVGIAEQHAVTFAAGLAVEHYKPFVAIYSTFLQRAYDQIVHDVAIQNLPVRFAIDRAGFVGSDGPTHAGSFDVAYLSNLPNFTVMAPSCAGSLEKMVEFAALYDKGPIAFRYPRDVAPRFSHDFDLQLGKSNLIAQGNEVAILSYGSCLANVLASADILAGYNIKPTIVDAVFAKPLDYDMLDNLVKNHKILFTIEEGAVGGFASQVNHYLLNEAGFDFSCKLRNICLPDEYIEQGPRDIVLENIGLGPSAIAKKIAFEIGIKFS